MIDKYKEIIIYELENGWIVKIVEPPNLAEPNQVAYISTYFETLSKIADYLKTLEKKGKK